MALQGLAPGFFEVQLQAFFGEGGVALARAAASYDILITNRLVLQPEFELNFSSGWDRDALIAPGLYRTEIGLRLRYEITRELADGTVRPAWNRGDFFGGRFGATAADR